MQDWKKLKGLIACVVLRDMGERDEISKFRQNLNFYGFAKTI